MGALLAENAASLAAILCSRRSDSRLRAAVASARLASVVHGSAGSSYAGPSFIVLIVAFTLREPTIATGGDVRVPENVDPAFGWSAPCFGVREPAKDNHGSWLNMGMRDPRTSGHTPS
jgi:hypothetical protein